MDTLELQERDIVTFESYMMTPPGERRNDLFNNQMKEAVRRVLPYIKEAKAKLDAKAKAKEAKLDAKAKEAKGRALISPQPPTPVDAAVETF